MLSLRSIPRQRSLLLMLFAAVPVALIAGGCASSAEPATLANYPRTDARAQIVVRAGEPLIIGVSESLTGTEAEAGKEDSDAVIASVMRWKAANGDQILGHDIQVNVEDDGCTESDITVDAAARLVGTPGLVGVLGPSCSAGAQAAIPFYAKAGIVAISGSATQSDLTTGQPAAHYFFRTSYRSDLQGMIGGQFVAQTLRARSAYLIDDGESYGRDLIESARQEMEAVGVTVTRASIVRGMVDFGDLAKQIATANPDFVGFGGFNPEAVLLFRQLRDAGYKGPFGSGDAVASVSTFVEPVGAQAAQGVYFVGCPLGLASDFLADFEKVHGSAPDASALTAQYADAATILLDAVSRVAKQESDGSLVIDPVALRDAVSETHLTDGVSGDVAFDGNGDRLSEAGELADQAKDLGLAACVVENGSLTNLFP